MGLIRLLAAPIRSILRFPLFQLAVVVVIILFLQAADDNSVFGRIFDGLDRLVNAGVTLFSELFAVKSFTRSGLTAGLMIGYVYLVCLLILFMARVAIRLFVDLLGWSNAFGLRNAIARERGIAAYRAWEPLEDLRPAEIPQPVWEERFAWPANDEPPYPSLWRRFVFEIASFVLVVLLVLVLLQLFTPIPALAWLASAGKGALGVIGW